jgi:hypothetical protein
MYSERYYYAKQSAKLISNHQKDNVKVGFWIQTPAAQGGFAWFGRNTAELRLGLEYKLQ